MMAITRKENLVCADIPYIHPRPRANCQMLTAHVIYVLGKLWKKRDSELYIWNVMHTALLWVWWLWCMHTQLRVNLEQEERAEGHWVLLASPLMPADVTPAEWHTWREIILILTYHLKFWSSTTLPANLNWNNNNHCTQGVQYPRSIMFTVPKEYNVHWPVWSQSVICTACTCWVFITALKSNFIWGGISWRVYYGQECLSSALASLNGLEPGYYNTHSLDLSPLVKV